MILKPEPLFAALEAVFARTQDRSNSRIIFPTPQGKLFTQPIAEELSQVDHLVFICGHYKAIDQRVIDSWVTDEISIGDFILSGGEIAVLLMVEPLSGYGRGCWAIWTQPSPILSRIICWIAPIIRDRKFSTIWRSRKC